MASWLLLAAIVLAPGDDAAPLAERVPALVKDLAADAKDQRDAAEKALLEIGPEALALLPGADPALPAERNERLARIRSQLERAQAEQFVAPTTVTLRTPSGMVLSRVLEQIQDQTGNSLLDLRGEDGGEVTDPRIKVDFQDTPFWQALDEVLDQASLAVDSVSSDQAVALVARQAGPTRKARAGYSGAFRFEPGAVTAQRDLKSDAHTLRVEYEVGWEPRLLPVAIYQAGADITALDDQGQPVAMTDTEQQLEVPVNPGMTSAELPLLLNPPARKIEKLSSIKGKLTALIPGGIETFKFEKVTKGKSAEIRKGAVVVGIDELQKNNDLWELRMHLRFDNAQGALDSYRGWVFNNETFLEDKDGNAIPPIGSETIAQGDNEVGIAYLFDLPESPEGYSFVYRSPVAIMSVPVEFELKDVELP